MSEFKFACPVCGQHITADSHSAGSQLECPTCFRKIVVPQGPSSSDPKFILAASEANKPRPQSVAAPSDSPTPPIARNAISISMILLVILVCAAGTTLFVVRGKLFRGRETPAADEASVEAVKDQKTAAAPVSNAVPVIVKPSLWTLNLTNAVFPSNTVSGRIRGQDFTCDRVILQGGTLTLRRGASGTPDLAVNINFFVNQSAQLANHVITLNTNNTGAPRVMLRWKEGGQTMMEPFTSGYIMKVELGAVAPGGMPGRIFLCLPDASNSWLAGTFNAEIRKPPAPKTPKKKT